MACEIRNNRIAWIDSLKGIAICGVLMIHCGGAALPSILGRLGSMGKNGVQIFFIISAFLSYSSLEKLSKTNQGNLSFGFIRNWWFQKFLKLVPLYYIAIFVSLFTPDGAAQYWLGSEGRVTPLNVLSHIFFVHGLIPHYIDSIIGVEWYLADLAIFYLLVPFLYRYVNSGEKAFVGLLLTMYGYSFFSRLIHLSFQAQDSYIYENYFASFWFVRQIPILFCGIVLYFFLKTRVLEKIKNKKLISYAVLILSGIMLAGEMYGKNTLFGMKGDIRISFWLTGIIISQFLYTNVLINNSIFRILGKYSYPIYLFHFLIIYVWDKMDMVFTSKFVIDWGIKYIMVIVISYLFSLFLTKWVDKPIQLFILKIR